ncbi:MAG: ThuA domain-containing protein [Bryobacterales bacterium]|nr:ThuA domain-containing protein [Bryobacterales bacterium]
MLFLLALLLAPGAAPAAPAAPAKIVLVAGKPSHGPGSHEFNAGVLLLEQMLRQNRNVAPVVVKGGWPEDESVFDGARAVLFYLDGGERHPFLTGNRMQILRRLMDAGVGLACMHYCVEIPKDNGGPELLEWLGGYYERPYSVNPVNDTAVAQATPKHPISRGWKSFSGKDEWYYKIRFRDNDSRVTPILTAQLPKDKPNTETLAWATVRANGGRSFGFTGGHFHVNWGIPDFRRMVMNALLWTARIDVPRRGALANLDPAGLDKNLDLKPPRRVK